MVKKKLAHRGQRLHQRPAHVPVALQLHVLEVERLVAQPGRGPGEGDRRERARWKTSLPSGHSRGKSPSVGVMLVESSLMRFKSFGERHISHSSAFFCACDPSTGAGRRAPPAEGPVSGLAAGMTKTGVLAGREPGADSTGGSSGKAPGGAVDDRGRRRGHNLRRLCGVSALWNR